MLTAPWAPDLSCQSTSQKSFASCADPWCFLWLSICSTPVFFQEYPALLLSSVLFLPFHLVFLPRVLSRSLYCTGHSLYLFSCAWYYDAIFNCIYFQWIVLPIETPWYQGPSPSHLWISGPWAQQVLPKYLLNEWIKQAQIVVAEDS